MVKTEGTFIDQMKEADKVAKKGGERLLAMAEASLKRTQKNDTNWFILTLVSRISGIALFLVLIWCAYHFAEKGNIEAAGLFLGTGAVSVLLGLLKK